MAIPWKQIGQQLGRQAARQFPRLLSELTEKSGAAKPQRQSRSQPNRSGTGEANHPGPGRPADSAAKRGHASTRPTSGEQRTLSYAPNLDGDADPGEVVWTWVEFEDDPSQGKDRPVLVVARSGEEVLALMMSSQGHRADDDNWLALGKGPWDNKGRPSFVRLDRVLAVDAAEIRREGAIMPKEHFDKVAAVLRASYGWK